MWNLELSKSGVEGLIWDVVYKVEALQFEKIKQSHHNTLSGEKKTNLIELIYQSHIYNWVQWKLLEKTWKNDSVYVFFILSMRATPREHREV